MAAPKPKLKTDDIIAEMNLLLARRDVDKFTLKRIQRDIDAVKPKAPDFAGVMQAALYVLERDFDAAFSESLRVIEKWPDSVWGLSNTEINLRRIGRIVDCSEQLIDATLHIGDSVELLDVSILVALNSGHVSNLNKLIERLTNLQPERSFRELTKMLESFELHNVTDAHTSQIAEYAYRCLRQYDNGRFLGRVLHIEPEYIVDDLGGEYLANRVFIPQFTPDDEDHVYQLNDDLCVGLADETFLNNPALNRFMVNFVLEERHA